MPRIKLARAALVGAAGAVVVVILLAIAQPIVREPTDLSAMLGALVWPVGGVVAWIIGAVGQLIAGTIAGILYGAIFELVFRHAGALPGFLVAIPHVVIAALAVGLLPVWLGTNTQAAPGAFLLFADWRAAACLVVAHLLFGVWMGVGYGRTLNAPAPPAPTWRDVSVAAEPEVRA